MTDFYDVITKLQKEGLSAATVREILQSAIGQKVSRIFLNDRQLLSISFIFDHLGLRFFVSKQKYLFTEDKGKGGFSNSIDQLLPENSPVGFFMVHLGRNIEALLIAREFDLAGDDHGTGMALGIPKCCIHAFIRDREAVASEQNDPTIFACRSTSGESDPWVVNCAQYFGYGLVSHFPCTMNCPETSKMAKEAASLLNRYAPKLANEFLKYQFCSYLYTEYDGIYAFLQRPVKEENGWRYNGQDLEMSSFGLLSEALRVGDRLVVRSSSDFTICSGSAERMIVSSKNVFLLFHESTLDDVV